MTTKEVCFHNDYQRVANEKRKHLSGKAGSVPIHTFFKYVEEPQLGEGFYEVNQVNFVAKFNDEDDRQAYHQFSKKWSFLFYFITLRIVIMYLES